MFTVFDMASSYHGRAPRVRSSAPGKGFMFGQCLVCEKAWQWGLRTVKAFLGSHLMWTGEVGLGPCGALKVKPSPGSSSSCEPLA